MPRSGRKESGGRTSKVHRLADDRSRPVALALTPDNVAAISTAPRLLGIIEPSRRVIADKAYDADSLRRWPATRGTETVVHSNAMRRHAVVRVAHWETVRIQAHSLRQFPYEPCSPPDRPPR